MRSHRTRPCPQKVSRRLGETVVETIPGIRFYQVKSLEEKKRKKRGGEGILPLEEIYTRDIRHLVPDRAAGHRR